MPELPDLVYIEKHLHAAIVGQAIESVAVRDPVVIRLMLDGPIEELLTGRTIEGVRRQGPFLVLELSGRLHVVVHFMLSGRFVIEAGEEMARTTTGKTPERKSSRRTGWSLSFCLRPGNLTLAYLDDNRMGKVYVCSEEQLPQIPGLFVSAPDIMGPHFTMDYLLSVLGKSRRQARALLLDHSLINVVGNAYADEILFEAGIHPKRTCASLNEAERKGLFRSIRSVMEAGIESVEKEAAGIDVKVRGHVRVRNRKDQPCPRCGGLIRRANVLGHDAFYCPRCQPWEKDIFGRLPAHPP